MVATVGRMAAARPLGFQAGDENLYRFVGNSPTNATDPTGLVSKKVDQGTLEWDIKVDGKSHVQFSINFTPDKGKCACKNISFIQVTLENTTGGKPTYPTPADYYKQLATPNGARLDHLRGETDPFYGAEWDPKKKQWVPEPGSKVGDGPAGTAAATSDSPNVGNARTGAGVKIRRFETFAVCIDTGEILGGVKWGYHVPDAAGSDIKSTGRKEADFSAKPSDDWRKALEKWNEVAKKNRWHTFTPKF